MWFLKVLIVYIKRVLIIVIIKKPVIFKSKFDIDTFVTAYIYK